MANGLETGFTVVFLLVVLAGLAVLLSLVTLASLVLERRTERIPRPLRYSVIVLFIEVIGVSVVGFLWVVSDAPVAAAMLATLVLFPLAAIAFRARRTTRLSRSRLITTVAMAWGPPFLVGLLVFFGVTRTAEAVIETGSSGPGLVGVGLFAAMASGVIVVIGVGWLTSRLSRRLEERDGEQTRHPE